MRRAPGTEAAILQRNHRRRHELPLSVVMHFIQAAPAHLFCTAGVMVRVHLHAFRNPKYQSAVTAKKTAHAQAERRLDQGYQYPGLKIDA